MSLEFKEFDKDADVSKHGPLPVIQGANKDFGLDRLETMTGGEGQCLGENWGSSI